MLRTVVFCVFRPVRTSGWTNHPFYVVSKRVNEVPDNARNLRYLWRDGPF